MDYVITLLLLLSFIWTCIHLLRRNSGTATRMPPGPYPFPVVGNIFQLGHHPHQSLAHLSKSYGPLMSLKMGTLTTIVISSPQMAKEVLHKNDHVFSSRTVPEAAQALSHLEFSMVWLPVAASKWRLLRKTCKEHLFAPQRLAASQRLRREKVQELLGYVRGCCASREAVEIGSAAFTTSLNLLSRTFFSIDLAHFDSNSSQEFKGIVWGVMELSGSPNFADYFPILKSMDPQGIRRRSIFYAKKLFAVFDGIIDQRLESGVSSSKNNDVLEALLDLSHKNVAELSCNDVKHLLMDLFLAGTDTTSSTVEWAMTELLKNPEKMTKAQTELEKVIGENGTVQESDISRLPYLQAVVKETFRLHPPAPFLVPHKAEADVEVSGFVVPKNAQIIVNIWATGRDSSVWLNPNSFVPERFLDCEIDFRGHDFELIPFGAGKRMCPGLPLAHRMVHLVLASLIHSFDWELEEGMEPKDVDMSEKFGLTLQKAIPLKAIPIIK